MPASDAGSSHFLFLDFLARESASREAAAACMTAGEILSPLFICLGGNNDN